MYLDTSVLVAYYCPRANELNLLTSDHSLAQCAKQLNVPHTLIGSLTST